MLLTFQGYFEAGKFTPNEPVSIPGRKKAIVTILDDEILKQSQTEALEEIMQMLEGAENEEELPLDLPRFNISRKIDL